MPCVAYPRQTGPVELGDTVLVNTQARDLELGSGGFDIVYANLTRGLGLPPAPAAHVMALPYTPGQMRRRRASRSTTRSPEALDGHAGRLLRRCTASSRPVVRRHRHGRADRVRAARGRRAAGRAVGHGARC